MQHGRLLAHAALFSIAFAAVTASAWPVTERWSPIPNSAVPAEGPLTTLVRGENGQTLIVRWNCGQPSPCSYTGVQNNIDQLTTLVVVPVEVGAPGRYFLFGRPDHCTSYGDDAQVGVWLTSGLDPVMQQCFHLTQTRYIRRSDALPPVRMARVQAPPNLAEITAAADARHRAQARPTP